MLYHITSFYNGIYIYTYIYNNHNTVLLRVIYTITTQTFLGGVHLLIPSSWRDAISNGQGIHVLPLTARVPTCSNQALAAKNIRKH